MLNISPNVDDTKHATSSDHDDQRAPDPTVALDIYGAATEVVKSRLRAEGVGTAPVPGGGLANPSPTVTKGR